MVTFFDSQGIIHTKFIPPNQTASKEYYVDVLSHLIKKKYAVKPQF
jgi:hypothetical protein